MEALILDEHGLQYRANHPDPEVGPEDVLIRVEAVGICGTDLAIVRGTLPVPRPIIPGHEIAGIVESCGKNVPDGIKDLIGKRVTTEINTNTCGKCFFCTRGMRTQCHQRKALGIDVDGGMAGYIAVHHDLVHPLPGTMDPREGTMIEPLAAAVQTFEIMPLDREDEHVVIIGDGKLGLLILQVIRALDRRDELEGGAPPGRHVSVLGHHGTKLALAEKLGADEVIDTSNLAEKKLFSRILEETGNKGADVVIEATGDQRALNQAIAITRERGKVALKSTHGVPVPFDTTLAVVKEVQVSTSRCGPFPKAIDLYRNGLVNLKDLISEVYPLSRGREAFKDLGYRRDAIKYVLEPRLAGK